MPPIGFLAPLFLAGLAALAVPIVLHLFRRRVEPVVPFSAVRLLRQLPVEQAKRRRLQDLWLLALRVAALALLALAFARPYLLTGEARSELPVTAVFVDVSASVDAPGRFARATALAHDAIDGAPRSHLVALGRFDSRADLLVAPTADRAVVHAAADALAPTAAATSYRAALARAAETIGGRGGRVVLITDLQTTGWDGRPGNRLPDGVSLEIQDVGPLPPNAGVVELDRTSDGVRVAVRNAGPARPLRLSIDLGGESVAVREVAARADAIEVVAVPLSLPERGALRAHLDDEEGLAADNERWLVLDPQPARRVRVIVAPGGQRRDGLYLASALQAVAGRRTFEVDLQPADRVRPETIAGNVSVIAVLGTAGLDRRAVDRLRTFVEEGGGLFVAAGPTLNVDLLAAGLGDALPRVQVGPAAPAPLGLAPADFRHPAFRVFANRPGAFDPVRFDRVATVLGAAGSRVLARFDTGAPALVEQPFGRGRVCVFASDVGNRWNDLALHPVFVPFAVETFAWLAGTLEAPEAVVAGETGLSGAGRPGVMVWRAPGADAGEPGHPVAVHVDAREFEPARDTPETFDARLVRRHDQSGSGPAVARRQEAEQGLWRYGLALMLLSLVVESVIGRRG